MNEKRFKQIFSGLTDPVKKVYSCVPAESECKDTLYGDGVFQVSDVVNQMKKNSLSGCDRRHVLGVLDSLKNSGLLIEPAEGYFKKVKIRDLNLIKHNKNTFVENKRMVTFVEIEGDKNLKNLPDELKLNLSSLEHQNTKKSEILMQNIETKPQNTPTKPIEKIGLLVMSAQKIMCDLKQLCGDIETVAIEVEQMFESSSKDAAKLRQLQSLLKGIDG